MPEEKPKKIGHMNIILWDKTEVSSMFLFIELMIWSFYDFSLENDYNFFIIESEKELYNITICYITTWILFFLGSKNNNGFAPEFQVKAESFSAHHYITKRYINAQVFHKLISLPLLCKV